MVKDLTCNKKMLEKTQADGIGLARGVLGKPWLFEQIIHYLSTNQFDELNFKQTKKVILNHLKLVPNTRKDVIEFRKHLGWYVRGFENAAALRSELMNIETKDQIKAIFSS